MGKERKGWKLWGSWLLVLMLAVGLAGCGAEDNKDTKNASSPSPVSGNSSAQAVSGTKTIYPLKLKDVTGTEVVIDKTPERVVSISPSETEAIFAIGAGSKVVGVDKNSNYPEEVKKLPQTGDTKTNLEALLAMKPDLVIANNGVQAKVVEQLRTMNVKVYSSDPKTLDEVMAKIEVFGTIMNQQEGAKKVTDKMRQEKQKVVDAVKNAPKKKVYMEFSPGWTVGDGEFMNELLLLAGGENVASGNKGWFQADPEKIIKANPDVILYAKDAAMGNLIYDELKKRPGFEQISAMKNNKLFAIESDLVSRVGPRLTQALIEMGKAIHPDLVK